MTDNLKELIATAPTIQRMSFELGKEYIVAVTDKGIVPVDEFNRERFYDKDNDDLDLLTDEEKVVVINDVLDKIKFEIELYSYPIVHGVNNHEKGMTLYGILQIIGKYQAETEDT